ncbi:MAG: hypothetical protein H7124_15935 [Phycisphaerales bacterium]|nr:hypothetical protein [Hyphomonadaceae bacterium]
MSTQPEYWFARRFAVGDRRNTFAPVHWKGFAATAVFIVALLIGGMAFAWMGASGDLLQGAILFAVCAFVAAGWFITVATAKGDKTRTVADYKKANPRV